MKNSVFRDDNGFYGHKYETPNWFWILKDSKLSNHMWGWVVASFAGPWPVKSRARLENSELQAFLGPFCPFQNKMYYTMAENAEKPPKRDIKSPQLNKMRSLFHYFSGFLLTSTSPNLLVHDALKSYMSHPWNIQDAPMTPVLHLCRARWSILP